MIGVIIAALIIFSLTVVILQIDNWQRDLFTNEAATSVDADDYWMRPLTVELSLEESEQLIMTATKRLSRWNFESRLEEADSVVLEFTRSTRFIRFVDDIIVRLSWTEVGIEIDIESRSRVGKGDLGQNPRNIKELREQLDQLLG